jgi:crotonobetainyl-CoA:carnitine CoA-transferase CaiB-like acyl-CoA transferase
VRKDEFFSEARTDLAGPLEGIRVLEATTSWAGPMAACLLADYGADVIKIEHPEGEIARHLQPIIPDSRLSLVNETVNRNKRSLTLDMRSDEGRELFLRLAARVDVVVENFKPGTLAKWGLGYPQVREVKPDIVYVSVSGFGQFGPLHDRPGYDPMAQAFSGWMSLNGAEDGVPTKASTWIGDDLAGIHGALGALAALRHRDRTGEGQHVDVALVDALLAHSNAFPSMARLGMPLQRTGNQFPVVAPFNVYRCADSFVYVGVALDSHWLKLLQIMNRQDLAEDPRFTTLDLRVEHREQVDQIVAHWCNEQPRDSVLDRLAEAGIPASPVNDYPTATTDPHVQARDMFQDVELSDGRVVPLLAPTTKFSRTPVRIRSAAPALGADNEVLLRELRDLQDKQGGDEEQAE